MKFSFYAYWQYLLCFIFLTCTFTPHHAFAQGEKQVIQFSGLIIDGDSSYGVPGVHIYVKKAGRGTVTDVFGSFNMPTLSGDSVTISAVGYKKRHLIVPRSPDGAFSVLIDLKQDTTYLSEVVVFPFPSIEVFKEAFLAMELPKTAYDQAERNLDPEQLKAMIRVTPMDGALNHKMYMNQYQNAVFNKGTATSIPLLNPFAWAEFIRSVKRGDFKRKRDD